MKNTTRIFAMLLFISFSTFSQTNIQWTGINSSDMSDSENWLTMDGSLVINPIDNNLIINNESSYMVDLGEYDPILSFFIELMINFGFLPNTEIIDNILIGTTGILNSPILNSNISVNSIVVNNTAGLEISPSGKLSIDGNLTNNTIVDIKSDVSGTGSLIVKGDIILDDESSTDRFRVERWFNTNGETKSHWHLVSAPTNNEHARIFKGHFLNYYKENTGEFKGVTSLNYEIKAGDGYVAKLDFNNDDGVSNMENPIVFKENKPNFGNIQIDLIEGIGNTYFDLPTNFNLIGNPYTSNLDWVAMWNDPSNKSEAEATMYYYVDDGSSQGDRNGWKTYNASTHLGDGDGTISTAQAFGVILNQSSGKTARVTPNQLSFKSDFQVHGEGNTFSKKGKTLENYFELNTSSNNLTDKIYFRFNENTSDAYDTNNDAYKLSSFGKTPTPYFVSSDNKKLAICEMPQSESVDIGFNMDTDEEVTFTLSNVYDFDEIILEDKVLNSFTDLIQESYRFQHNSENDETGRFTLHFKKETLSEVEESVGMKVYSSNNEIFIKANKTLTNVIVNIFNTNGQLVLSRSYSSLNDVQLTTDLSNGVYLVDISSNQNKFTTRVSIKH